MLYSSGRLTYISLVTCTVWPRLNYREQSARRTLSETMFKSGQDCKCVRSPPLPEGCQIYVLENYTIVLQCLEAVGCWRNRWACTNMYFQHRRACRPQIRQVQRLLTSLCSPCKQARVVCPPFFSQYTQGQNLFF
jgi:hypothetical protein